MYYEIILKKNELGATALKNYFAAHSIREGSDD